MTNAPGLTVNIVLRLKQGINLESAASGVDSNSSSEVQTLAHALRILSSQPGSIQQYWGHQIEDPSILVLSSNWESLEKCMEFIQSEHHVTFRDTTTKLAKSFDAPYTVFFVPFSSSPIPACEAPVTEVALFTLPEDATEGTRKEIEEAMATIGPNLQTIGKAKASATGWISRASAKSDEGETFAFCAMVGYDSVEHHMNMIHIPELAETVKTLIELGPKYELKSGKVYDRGMFHVKFHKGI